MNKKLKIFSVVLVCILGTGGFWYLTRSDAERTVLSCWKWYHQCWSLSYAEKNPESGEISVEFRYHHPAENHQNALDSLEKPYRILTETFPDVPVKISYWDAGNQFDCFRTEDGLEIYDSLSAVTLSETAKLFPETRTLYLFPARYDDIHELEGFQDLRYLYFSQSISEQEQQEIHDMFPDCEILVSRSDYYDNIKKDDDR